MTSDQQDRKPRPSITKESGLLQRARRFLREAFPGTVSHLVVGYSGGKDSLALLLVLRDLERLGACRLTVVHVDHGLRPGSGEDAARAVEIGRSLGVEVRVVFAETPLVELFPGRGVEDAARSFRYQVLARVAEEVGADAIAVAHHAQDQAETVLLHLLRGSGLAGLSGMAADSVLPVPDAEMGATMRVVRPFLHEPPEALVELVGRSGVPVVDDPSNIDPGFRRNRIRHELLPLIEEIAPGATGRLVSLADILDADDAALDDTAHALMHRMVDEDGNLGWNAMRNAPVGLQRRVVRHWILHSVFAGDLGRERVDAVVVLASRNEGGKQVELGGGWSVRYGQGRLELIPPAS